MPAKLLIKPGDKYNFLTIIKEVEQVNKSRYFQCKCVCGNIKNYKLNLLRRGESKSCGCKRIERFIKQNTRHNLSRTKIYTIWTAMKQRCLNVNHKHYSSYGGRGIDIHSDWLNVQNFIKWAKENGYKEGLTLDRIDVNKGYNKDNCRWVTMTVQCRNKRDNVFYEFNGKNQCVADWAKDLSINHTTLTKRINRWGLEKALTTPKSVKNDTSNSRNRKQG